MDTKVFNFIKACLNLFKAVPIIENLPLQQYALDNKQNLENGFFITGTAFKDCPYVCDRKVLSFIKDNFGYNIFELNQGFYKSFKKVADLTPQQILFNKLVHYFSTYGGEKIGVFERDFVYIPNSVLKLPEEANPLKIFIVGSIQNEEIKNRANGMIQSGAALSEESANSLAEIVNYLDIKLEINDLPNKELLIKLCEKLNILPKNPVQFLRFMIYLGTGSTLLIKDSETIESLKNSQVKFDEYFIDYINENGIAKLASIFHRFKPLWLAFKPHSAYLKTTINKMRKLADRYHKPFEPKLLENLTSTEKVNLKQLQAELSKVTTYKKISLANALLYRNAAPENIVYSIRNGKTFVDEYSGKLKNVSEKILDVIINSIVEDVKPNVQGKKIYIPENFTYAVPVSDKKFVGNIPYGSCYSFKNKSCVVGVHWFNITENHEEIRVDLDLHLNGKGIDVGWTNDSDNENSINTKKHKIIFSGDMTDAPLEKGGATEVFFIGELLIDKIMMLNLNHYNHKLLRLYKKDRKDFVPFKLILADVEQERIDRQYLIDSHEVAFCVPCKIDSGGIFLGFIVSNEDGEKRFYFSSRNMGSRVVAKTNALTTKFISAMNTNFETCLSLNEILNEAGAILENVDKSDCDINLDPVEVTKDTLIGLLAR